MKIIVQKYGGTSVESKEKLEKVCDKIIEYSKKDIKLVVVVSAQGKTTNELIQKANEYVDIPSKKELDLLLTTGEIQTVALITMMLKEKGYEAVGLNGEQAGIITDSTYGDAAIETIFVDNILKYLQDDNIVVVAGFQGTDKFGNITTLGRGGSDLTAVALASALKANQCEIYTDVDGIYSADPKIVEKPTLLENVTYDEILEASTSGAKVLHNKSVYVAKKFNMPIVVKNSQNDKKGSIVTDKENPNCNSNVLKDVQKTSVRFISKKEDVAKVSIIGDLLISNKKIAGLIFQIASEENIEIQMMSFSELTINILVSKESADKFVNRLHEKLIS